jgi:hypothetical protein
VSIILWLELVAALGTVQAFFRDIGQPLPMGIFELFALVLLAGVVWWRVKGNSSIGDGKLLLYGLLPLLIGAVVGVGLASVLAAKGLLVNQEQAKAMSIHKIVGLQHDRSYCGDVVKLEGTVREMAPGQAVATNGNAEAYALEDDSDFIMVILNKKFGRPIIHQHLEVTGPCACSVLSQQDPYSPISRVVLERTRTPK